MPIKNNKSTIGTLFGQPLFGLTAVSVVLFFIGKINAYIGVVEPGVRARIHKAELLRCARMIKLV